ncbi:unannotated protein [freshwater metagenome]|uniref:Unannotated protein n=1 Tax=freshwater metagenome TaxID=449393 RepID=A0A6J5ZNT2_9ZZZZ
MCRLTDLLCGILIANLQLVDLVESHSCHFAKFWDSFATLTAAQSELNICTSLNQKSVNGSSRILRRSLKKLIAMNSFVFCVSSIAQRHSKPSCRQSLLDRSDSHSKVARQLFHSPMQSSRLLQSEVLMKSVSECHTAVALICWQISPVSHTVRFSRNSRDITPRIRYTVLAM